MSEIVITRVNEDSSLTGTTGSTNVVSHLDIADMVISKQVQKKKAELDVINKHHAKLDGEFKALKSKIENEVLAVQNKFFSKLCNGAVNVSVFCIIELTKSNKLQVSCVVNATDERSFSSKRDFSHLDYRDEFVMKSTPDVKKLMKKQSEKDELERDIRNLQGEISTIEKSSMKVRAAVTESILAKTAEGQEILNSIKDLL